MFIIPTRFERRRNFGRVFGSLAEGSKIGKRRGRERHRGARYHQRCRNAVRIATFMHNSSEVLFSFRDKTDRIQTSFFCSFYDFCIFFPHYFIIAKKMYKHVTTCTRRCVKELQNIVIIKRTLFVLTIFDFQ